MGQAVIKLIQFLYYYFTALWPETNKLLSPSTIWARAVASNHVWVSESFTLRVCVDVYGMCCIIEP